MPSQTHSTLDSGLSTPPSDDEVLVRVEGVSKKFCRSLKKSLWYGVCDIASELLPVGKRRGARDEGRELSDRSAQNISRSPLDAGLSTAAAASSGSATALDARPSTLDSSSGSALALDARPSTLDSSSPALDSRPSPLDSTHGLRAGEFFAVKDVSFELRRGELRTLGRSEKEISKKCLDATKVPDSGRRRHQCLGLIGHNGAGNQAAGQPLGRLPQGSPKGEMSGSERINTTLLKMLNGLIKPDSGSITMRGRVASWSMLKTPQANGAHFRSTLGPGRSTPLPINGSVLWLTKKH